MKWHMHVQKVRIDAEGRMWWKKRGRFGDFAYDLFGKRANPEL